jgi:hypothetical protein
VDQRAAKGQFILTGSATPNHKGILHSGDNLYHYHGSEELRRYSFPKTDIKTIELFFM